ncbi:MAG: DNA polymerase [Limnohabitans sp.]
MTAIHDGLTITEHFALLGDTAAFDTETAMAPAAFKGQGYVRLFQAYSESHSFWIDLAELSQSQWAELKGCLERKDLTLIWQNAAFDLRVLAGCGINPMGQIHDTMLLSWLLTNGDPRARNNLEAIALRELGVKLDKTLQKQDWMNATLTKEDLHYALKDVEVTWQAFHAMHPRVKADGLDLAYEVELKAIRPTFSMEAAGLHLDRALLDEQMQDLAETRDSSLAAFIEELDTELQDYGQEGLPRLDDGSFNLNKKTTGSVRLGTKVFAGFNPGSSQQVLKYLNAIDIDPRDPSGKPSVDKKYLRPLAARTVVKSYLDWKRCDKHLQMCNSLIDAQAEDGRIYARFNPTGTFTGRYSSSNPNLQNIPRGAIRYCFNAPEGREMVDLDYGGMELRALCSPRIADEPRMRDAFNGGRDVHRATAALMFKVPEEEITDEERRQAKAVNFGAAYGSGPGGLVNYFQSIGEMISLAEGEAFLKAWLDAYPNIAKWHNNCRAWVESGAPVRMVDGRRRWLLDDAAKHTTMANNIVQGSCASAMKLALYAIFCRLAAIDPSARLVAVIHDEVLIECAEGKGEEILVMAQEAMVEAGREIFGDAILLEAEGGVGDSWGSAKG